MADRDDVEEVTRALLLASRALVSIAARSLDDLDDDVSLPQFRILVVLATRGPRNLTELAGDVGINPSTAHRLCNRLIGGDLLERSPSPTSRREVVLELTDDGSRLIGQVMERRQAQMRRIVRSMTAAQRTGVVEALQTFAQAAGENPEQAWSGGWYVESLPRR